MAIEFMTGATVFALINLILFAVACYFVYRLAVKLAGYLASNEEDRRIDFKVEALVVLTLLIAMVLFGSVAQPKISLEPASNRELIEYQESKEEVVIETPPPRTEELNGFTSMK